MSHGPPPPHFYGYPPPPPPPGPPVPGPYSYVPAMGMMPMYPHPHHDPTPPPPQPTYVTNYIYQQPPQPQHLQPQQQQPLQPTPIDIQPEPVQIAEELIDWVPATSASASTLTHRAFVGGKEGWVGSPVWIIRAHHGGEFIPGKLALKNRSATVPYAGKEVPVHNFEVLCAPAHVLRWVPASNGQVPVGAIAAGNTHSAEPLYVARVKYLRSITPGKVHPSHGCCYITTGGNEIAYKNYEVLCKIVG